MHELTSRYALALYSLKKESSSLEETQKEIKELMKIIIDNPEFLAVLDSSQIDKDERLAIVEKVFGSIDVEIKNFIKIIVENGRAKYLYEIFQDFNSLVNEYRGVKEGLLYSSEKLTDEQIALISESISKKEEKPVELKNVIDPSLIGGIKVVINDHIYDGSLKHHIEQLKLALLNKEGKKDEN